MNPCARRLPAFSKGWRMLFTHTVSLPITPGLWDLRNSILCGLSLVRRYSQHGEMQAGSTTDITSTVTIEL